jgi:hypothetical protein
MKFFMVLLRRDERRQRGHQCDGNSENAQHSGLVFWDREGRISPARRLAKRGAE